MSALRQIATAMALCAALPALAAPRGPSEQDFVDMPDEPSASAQGAPQPAADEKAHAGYLPGYRPAAGVGLAPDAPQLQPSLPGALTPPFGAPVRTGAFRLSFRGYLQAAVRGSVGERQDPQPGQGSTTLHGDPLVPGVSYGWFDHSGTVPDPWTELNFSYGNDRVATTLSLAAWSLGEVDSAGGSSMPHAQLWVTNAFLSYTPDVGPVRWRTNVGVFPDRYGFMGRFQQGAYGEVLIGGIHGMGATSTLELPFEGDLTVSAEAGFKGQFDKAPLGIPFDASTNFARAEQGSTFAAHGHLGITYLERYTLTGHLIHSWSQDDRKDAADAMKDGLLDLLGADLRLDARRFGHLYLGFSHASAQDAGAISNLVRVLNSGGGYEFNERFFGFASGGTGALTLLGGQYTISLGTLLRHPMDFWGEGPDLSVSLFGVYGQSASAAPQLDKRMLKVGGEAVYSFSEYVAAAVRVDQVAPDLAQPARGFTILSPRLVFRTGWLTRESVTIQYSYYALGDEARVEGDRRLVNATSQRPDRHLLAAWATVWW